MRSQLLTAVVLLLLMRQGDLLEDAGTKKIENAASKAQANENELDCNAECNGCTHARDSKACQQCKNLRVERRVGDTKETECVPKCPVGMYLSDKHDGLCVPCSGGTFKSTPGNEKCTTCGNGTFSPDEASSCGECPAGTYMYGSESQNCGKCPPGKYSASSGAESCTECPVGTFSEEPGMSECDPCPHGHFGNSTGMSQCEQCEAGYYADQQGMTSCTKCPPGSIAKCIGSTSCSQCAMGTYQPNSGQSKCRACSPGSAAPWGASVCQNCSEFQYARKASGNCMDCPHNALVKSDKVHCYRRIFFLPEYVDASGADSSGNGADKASDGNRSTGYESYVGRESGSHYKIWMGGFDGLNKLRKVVLWSRPDKVNQFIGIEIFAIFYEGPMKHCGTVQHAARYVVFDCDHLARGIYLQRTNRASSIAVAEVEAYGD